MLPAEIFRQPSSMRRMLMQSAVLWKEQNCLAYRWTTPPHIGYFKSATVCYRDRSIPLPLTDFPQFLIGPYFVATNAGSRQNPGEYALRSMGLVDFHLCRLPEPDANRYVYSFRNESVGTPAKTLPLNDLVAGARRPPLTDRR